MYTAPGDRRHPLRLVPDAVIDRHTESGDSGLKIDMPCCDLALELPDELGVVRQAGCPHCQLAYTVELICLETARFTLIGPIAIASPRRPPPTEGLTWQQLGQRHHLVSVDNSIIGVVTGGTASNSFTARRYGTSDRLPRTFGTVEAAALALSGAYANHIRPG